MIDLHLHTTASDGACTPEQLVDQAAAAGLTTIAVTDHDTVAATETVSRLAAARGLRAIAGTEVTAVDDGRDVHVLGYFLDHHDPRLLGFLVEQRESRVARVEAITVRLAELGVPIDASEVLTAARRPGHSVGRPQVAWAMVRAGYVADVREAFDAWLGEDGPAFVPRAGPSTHAVLGVIHDAGGLAALAHPAVTAIDGRIAELRRAGLDAIEVYHSRHSAADRERYLAIARDLSLLVTGGSDYHGDPAQVCLGAVSLPAAEWYRVERHRR